jgi:hypothetical protein
VQEHRLHSLGSQQQADEGQLLENGRFKCCISRRVEGRCNDEIYRRGVSGTRAQFSPLACILNRTCSRLRWALTTIGGDDKGSLCESRTNRERYSKILESSQQRRGVNRKTSSGVMVVLYVPLSIACCRGHACRRDDSDNFVAHIQLVTKLKPNLFG